MVDLDKNTIKNLSKLSRIECTEEEQEALLKDLKEIISYFEQLSEVEVDHLAPCNHVLEDILNVTREDVAGETLPREVFLNNAPSHIGGMIKVPPVLKQN